MAYLRQRKDNRGKVVKDGEKNYSPNYRLEKNKIQAVENYDAMMQSKNLNPGLGMKKDNFLEL
jgi:predicted S18 family serine protease